MEIVKVIPLIRLPARLSEFDYMLPDNFEQKVVPGSIARINFRSRMIMGIVTDVVSPAIQKKSTLKTIHSLISPQPLISIYQLEFIKWFSSYYCVSETLPALMCTPPLPSIKGVEIPIMPHHKRPQKNSHVLFITPDQYKKNEYYDSVISKNIHHKKQTLIVCAYVKDAFSLSFHLKQKYGNNVVCTSAPSLPSQHLKNYLSLMSGEPSVIVGTRSSLFLNIPLLASLIIDRSERREYKQFDCNPRYDTRDVAFKICEFSGADLIHSSHAPRLEDWEHTKMHRTFSFNMPQQIFNPRIIQLNQEWRNGHGSFLSQNLLDAIPEVLKKNKHVFLYLNRKGFGSSVLCETCCSPFVCSECAVPQIYSKRTNLLTCAQCKRSQELPLTCPSCHGAFYRFLGYGIERIAQELKKIFPNIPVIEYSKEEKKIKNQQLFQSYSPHIIIGTSYFLNEHSDILNSLGLITILHGDIIVSKNDFRSTEYQFQEIMHIINLVKNHSLPLYIQIFRESTYPLGQYSQKTLEEFYVKLLEERKKQFLPPFTCMIKIFPKIAAHSCENLLEKLKNSFGDSLRYQLKKGSTKKDKGYILLSANKFPETLFSFLIALPPGWMIDRDPVTF